jgi:2-oxo-4-hydroxy-4-carboxy-5-ureidoimidazoline decarboxylase
MKIVLKKGIINLCARLNKKDAILTGLETRLENDLDEELSTGIGEVMKICSLRIKDIVQDDASKL